MLLKWWEITGLSQILSTLIVILFSENVLPNFSLSLRILTQICPYELLQCGSMKYISSSEWLFIRVTFLPRNGCCFFFFIRAECSDTGKWRWRSGRTCSFVLREAKGILLFTKYLVIFVFISTHWPQLDYVHHVMDGKGRKSDLINNWWYRTKISLGQ